MSKVTILMIKVMTAPDLLLGASAVVFAGHDLSIAFSRVLYPYDLDFIEDAILMQAWRVAQNQPVYQPPNRTSCLKFTCPCTPGRGAGS